MGLNCESERIPRPAQSGTAGSFNHLISAGDGAGKSDISVKIDRLDDEYVMLIQSKCKKCGVPKKGKHFYVMPF
ncbi:MAG: hypothetical protein JSV60_02705 [Desulfobacterales bacterium]|jgi:hypothetical protein|nr:MAG: hypothetical protein JSV60_02705 [Desulfobacterales bacterium]